jgi:hypothetical protein
LPTSSRSRSVCIACSTTALDIWHLPSELRWVWPTGEELLFRFGKEESDYWDYHGQEFPFIGFNELTNSSLPNSTK